MAPVEKKSLMDRFGRALGSQKALYTALGALVGTIFPIGSVLLDWFIRGVAFDLIDILSRNPLHFLVATSPFVLGFLARLAGNRQDRITAQSREMADLSLSLRARTQEMGDVFAHIDQGILTINRDFTINREYSARVEDIFNRRNLGASNFLNLVYPLGPAQNKKDLLEYLELLFTNQNADDEILRNLNPIQTMEYAVSQDLGEIAVRYFRFEFARIRLDGVVTKILIIINDLTVEHEREKQFAQERRTYAEELDRIHALISVDPDTIDNFLRDYENLGREIEAFYSALTTSALSPNGDAALAEFLSRLHALKGLARFYKLTEYGQRIHQVEEKCRNFRRFKTEDGDDAGRRGKIMEVMVALSEYKIALMALQETRDKLLKSSAKRGHQIAHTGGGISRQQLEQLRFLQKTLGEIIAGGAGNSQAAEIPLAIGGFRQWSSDFTDLTARAVRDANAAGRALEMSPPEIRLEFPEDRLRRFEIISPALIQCMLNAVAHGIETPADREKAGKNRAGRFSLTIRPDGTHLVFICADDGQGIDAQAIRAMLIRHGIFSASEAASLSDEQVLRKLLATGGSSKEEQPGLNAGHGLGMGMIHRIVHENRGSLKLINHKGHGLDVVMRFPIDIFR